MGPSLLQTRMLLTAAMLIFLNACAPSPSRDSVETFPAPGAVKTADGMYLHQTYKLTSSGLPIAVVAGDQADLWIVSEFSNSLDHVSPGPIIKIERREVPLRVEEQDYPFVNHDDWRNKAAMSERIIKDSKGRLWFAQNGHWLNFNLEKDVQDYSRIVSYDPKKDAFCVYPVPDNQSSVMGVAWDEDRNLLWFSQSGNSTLVAFNPDKINDCQTYNRYHWDFDERGRLRNSFPVRYCSGSFQKRCMRKYPLGIEPKALINQLVVQQPGQPDAGAVWVTEYFGGKIGRFDPETREYEHFPIDKSKYIIPDRPGTWMLRAHHILTHPKTGDIVFSANGSGRVIKFDIKRYLRGKGACDKLDDNDLNPCMDAIEFPNFDSPSRSLASHSITFDRHSNLWVSTWSSKCPVKMVPPSIGLVDADWKKMVLLDHLQLPPGAKPAATRSGKDGVMKIPCAENGLSPWAFKGIAVDADNTIWFTNYYQRLVHRLQFTGGANQNPYDVLCTGECRELQE